MIPTIRHPRPARQRGLSIGLIMVAVALLAVMGMAMMLTDKTGNLTSEDNKNRILASALLQQATRYKDALFAKTEVNGSYLYYSDDSTTPGWSLHDPSTGMMEVQQPPPGAYMTTSSANWVYKFNSSTPAPTVTLMNIGTSAADYVVATVNLKQAVCQQINLLLRGSTTVAVETTGSSSAWSNATTIMNLSTETAVNGVPSQCVQTTDGVYVFYYTLRAQ